MIHYSLLTSDRSVLADKRTLQTLLSQGIKVIVFGAASDLDTLSLGLESYKNARLLQLYPVAGSLPVLTVKDGALDEKTHKVLECISAKARSFNFEQYLIEHADANNSLFVEAGAGTGKTTVMVDRILFLLHTVPDLTMEDIGMITFTNEATQNMKHKIQAALMQRYLATQAPRYLKFLENSSKIQIQTIHSFSRSIINELGTSIGYAQSIGLKSFKYEKRQIIHDVLDEKYKLNKKALSKVLGAQLFELDKLLLDFWTQLENIGLTDEEIATLDWGTPANDEAKALHDTLSSSFQTLNERYNDLKMEEDAIAVGDIVRELRRILDQGVELAVKETKLKYLFVDEFQDSDNAQIKTIAWLHKVCGLKLFAVGDAKQSIYRFRGAVETAFDKLRSYIKQNTDIKPNEFTLIRNYRTSRDVLDALEPIFRHLENEKLLDYGKSLVAQKHHPGQCNMRHVRRANTVIQEQTVRKLKETLADCVQYAKAMEKTEDPSQHVTVLVRTNYQLSLIGQWCEEAKIPCYIKKEGTFFASQAVRDFYCLVKAYLFPSAPAYLFDYLNSPYTTTMCDVDEVSQYAPGTNEQLAYLWERLENHGWEKYHREFRLKPVLSVLREIIDERRPAAQYVAKRKLQMQNEGDWEESDLEKQLAIEASQYEANLEKLLQMLRKHFSGQMASLYQVNSFLEISIATNKTEDEPDISGEMGCGCVYGMTVHKAKGLEFDTVLLPLTHRVFRKEIATELILDETQTPKRVGWSKVTIKPDTWNEVSSHLCNDYYQECLVKEFEDVDREEARLLYVALTRAIRRLECFIVGNEQHSWAHMLEV